jgi:hypothetical protein
MRRVIAVVLMAAIAGGGCGGHGHGGKLVAEYPRGRTPLFGWTENPAEFVLYARQHPEASQQAVKVKGGWELGRWRLEKRSPLGFETVNGQLVAVAGREEMPLPPGAYCWHVRPGSERMDWGATALFVVLLAGLGFVVYAAWWSATWDFGENWGHY